MLMLSPTLSAIVAYVVVSVFVLFEVIGRTHVCDPTRYQACLNKHNPYPGQQTILQKLDPFEPPRAPRVILPKLEPVAGPAVAMTSTDELDAIGRGERR